jgi:UDP-N-acetylglucosamine--N-acetylmuramyl-(pentapeptide) pyrophosphoryl-undecaprenol N-acetylglucosamine transferase
VGQQGVPLTLVDVEGIHSRAPSDALRALAMLPRAVGRAMRTILDLQPAAVLGVGGYASGAGVVAAGILGVPYVLQEQNSIPGLTNRFLAPWAALVCCGFSDAVDAFPSMPAEWTGNPVRGRFFDVPEVEPEDPPRLLVLGGSQGSLFLNRTVPQALAVLRDAGINPTIHHQAGVRWAEVVRTAYEDLMIDADVVAFLAEPWVALERSDLVVARSGALTVSELSAAGRGALMIPFAAAAGGHQVVNARALERAGGAVVLTESEASPYRVAEALEQLLTDRDRLREMGRSARTVALPHAARRIASRVLAVGGGG